MITITVVVLNYRRHDQTLECLDSLSASTGVRLDVIVVDNNSGDGSAGVIRASRADTEVVETGANLGYTGGMNAGLRLALERQAELIFVINSDTLVAENALALLVGEMQDHPEAGAVTGTFFYHPDTSRVWYAGGALAYRRAHAVTVRTVPSDGKGRAVTFLTGCAVLFRASALRAAGLFDERFFMYLEDVDLSQRLVALGFQLRYVPQSRLYHRLTLDEQTPLKAYYVTRNRLLFLESSPRAFDRLCGRLFVLGVLTLRLPRWLATDPMLVRATVMGIRDYGARRFGAGRGLDLSVRRAGGGSAHAHRD